MDIAGKLRRRLRDLLRDQHGMALPTALFALIASFGLASAAVLSSIDVQQGAGRDNGSKNAIAAADAGASVAMLRLNRFMPSEAHPCVGPAGEYQTPTGGWCPATEPESVGGSTFSYRVSAFEADRELDVVAVGTADGVSRRVEVGLVSYHDQNVFADEHLIGQDNITLEGTPDVRTDVGTNGDITSEGSGTLCGDIRHGIGKTAPEPDCDGEVSEGNKDLPEIVPPENIETENSNCRLVPDCTGPEPSKEVDPYSKQRKSNRPWDAATRTINISQNATLTVGGTDYFVCRLKIENGELIMAAGSHVRIFFDTPENCGISAGESQIEVAGNGTIKSTGYNPDEGKFDVIGLYVLGSTTIPTTVKLTGGSDTNELVLYAPHSDIDLGGNATWVGMVAGQSLRLHGTPTVESDPGLSPPDLNYTSLWERTHYVECTGATASPPNAEC